MTSFRRQLALKALELIDIFLLTLVLAMSTVASYYFQAESISLLSFLEMRISVRNFLFVLVFLLGGHLSLSISGLYHSRRLSTRMSEALDILKVTSLGSALFSLLAYMFHLYVITPVFVIVFWIGSTTLLTVNRILLRRLLEFLRLHGRNLRHVIIVGTNERTLRFARKIQTIPQLGYRLLGFVDDNWEGSHNLSQTGNTLLCSLADFPSYLRVHAVDEVVIGLPVKSLYQQSSQITAFCEELGIIVRHLSSLFNPRRAHSEIEEFEDDFVITFHSGLLEGWPLLAKKALDLLISSALLILLLPFLIITMLIIKLTSPGPVFFIQERLGLNKRLFRLYKFRTMTKDAESRVAELEHLNEVEGPAFKIKNDPRVTAIGKWLRKTSIDELPQLFNVLKGDMSLVGPRPLPVRDYNGFDQDWQRRRFSVRPGITCLWQAYGRSNVSFDRWMELDMKYIDQWSLWLDLKILARTIPAVLKGVGAE